MLFFYFTSIKLRGHKYAGNISMHEGPSINIFNSILTRFILGVHGLYCVQLTFNSPQGPLHQETTPILTVSFRSRCLFSGSGWIQRFFFLKMCVKKEFQEAVLKRITRFNEGVAKVRNMEKGS